MPTLVQPVSHKHILKIRMVFISNQTEIAMAVCVSFFLSSLYGVMEVHVKTINLLSYFPPFCFLSSLPVFHLPVPLLFRWVSMLPDNEKLLTFWLVVLEICFFFSLMNFCPLELKRQSPQGTGFRISEITLVSFQENEPPILD